MTEEEKKELMNLFYNQAQSYTDLLCRTMTIESILVRKNIVTEQELKDELSAIASKVVEQIGKLIKKES